MSSQAVEVEILGKRTRVSCPAGEEDSLAQAALDLDNRLKEMSSKTKITNEVQLLTFTALNICYELQSNNGEAKQNLDSVTKKLEALTVSIDSALNKVQHGTQYKD
ncbi:cell division protein ZapA [Vibrio sp. FNV 38]|nr:cell division protein ZapA [Vibrio sp. FNV 38]